MRTERVLSILAGTLIAALAAISLPAAAGAAGESATVGIKLDPRGNTFFQQAYRAGKLSLQTGINVPPGSTTIDPMKQANLQLPSSGNLTFKINPKMPVCPNSKVNSTTVSVPVETIVAACPKSIIGNGTAQFALAQQTSLPRGGVVILFNGGKQASGPLKGQPRIMLYAYSYDTEVGLYTEAALARDGSLDFPVPVLTADSSVTSINLNFPGVPTSVDFPAKGITANLPAGQDPSYVQAKCAGSSFGFSGEFLLGKRPEGLPPGPTTTLNTSSSYPCSGAVGRANLKVQRVNGAKRLRRGQTKVYRVRVKNRGTRVANGVRISVRGKWVKNRNQRVGRIPAGRAKTFKVRAGLQGRAKRGKTTVIKFRINAKQTRATVGKTRVRVQ